MLNLSSYSKTVSALATGALGWAAVVIASPAGPISAAEWLMLGVAGATALGVYGVPNIKAAVAPPAPPVVDPS